MKSPGFYHGNEMLKRIKDPTVRMRLAIQQDSPRCSDCKHWLPDYQVPWCKKHEHLKTSSPMVNNIKNSFFCPDFDDQPE